eukprot:CAMPEP_0201893878 /NCGR_PEP_ID=MMETSP0902-20130614/39574_1 /ASSEMBLY_ACC=CAM_ASM_000551 /TAXON_ID=420261 /ORGANISM="Thalassiosira antarctica, Strain CCMP982" /LENGTH=401 /DNA_ID=CAMNT_0048425795 /DNA_START=10 /DNA_END=1215 /DNA_ORIENTATION=+
MASLQQTATCLAVALLSFSDCSESFPISRGVQPALSRRNSPLRAKASETEETDTQIRDRILEEIDTGFRTFPQTNINLNDWGEPDDVVTLENEDDDTAIDASTLGQWDERDVEDKFDYEWDPDKGDEDPNNLDPNFEYVEGEQLDEEGIEVGYNPVFGHSNPIDGRTILNPPDSYVIDEKTRDDRLVTKDFPDGDPELKANAEIIAFRKSLKQTETYTDEFLKMEVPRHTAKWHGYPEQLSFPKQDYMNNRFTKPEDATDFDALGAARARKVAVQMARAKNNEWLPEGTSAAYHARKTAIYREKGVLVGSLLAGEIDEDVVAKIQPALSVLGDVVELLSIEMDTVFRFKYHGLIKNKRGMSAWAGVLIRNCDVDCTNVVFETGYRKRDPAYDGGDYWSGPY